VEIRLTCWARISLDNRLAVTELDSKVVQLDVFDFLGVFSLSFIKIEGT
jgi:hypothetical protein